jgi:hypothetical protein
MPATCEYHIKRRFQIYLENGFTASAVETREEPFEDTEAAECMAALARV